MGKWLAIDSAVGACSAAIFDGTNYFEVVEEETSKQTERLIPMIKELCERSNLQLHNMDGIIATKGPGSFTGIRIGMSAAKGIAIALGIPLYSVTTMDAMRAIAPADQNLITILNAGKQQVYAQISAGDEIKLIDYAKITNICPDQEFYIAGKGIELVEEFLPTYAIKLFHIMPNAMGALKAFLKQKNLDKFTPLYIRPPDALKKQAPYGH